MKAYQENQLYHYKFTYRMLPLPTGRLLAADYYHEDRSEGRDWFSSTDSGHVFIMPIFSERLITCPHRVF